MGIPKVSVIVPFRNAEKYVAQAFKCMEAIDFHSWELIFVDDGSTDRGLNILTELSERSSLNVLILRNHTSKGAGQARNIGVRAATGEYVWFADCDDEWSADILKHFWIGVVNDAVDVVVCDLEKVYEATGGRLVVNDAPSREVISGFEVFNRVLRGNVQGHLVNKLIRKDLLDRNPLPNIRAHEDLACLLKVFWSARTVSFVPGVMYSYLIHGGSLMQSAAYRWEDLLEVAKIADRILFDEPSSSKFRCQLDAFKLSHILIPAASTMAAQGRIDISRLPFVNKVHFKTLLTLLMHKRWLITARIIFLKTAPHLYGVVQNRVVSRKVLS